MVFLLLRFKNLANFCKERTLQEKQKKGLQRALNPSGAYSMGTFLQIFFTISSRRFVIGLRNGKDIESLI